MSRKDSKGRVLRTGESQRSDGRYSFRYTLRGGIRKTVYASTLSELRKKEAQIQKEIDSGNNLYIGEMIAYDYIKRFNDQDQSVKWSTKKTREEYLKTYKQYPELFQKKIKDITSYDVREWMMSLCELEYCTSTIKAKNSLAKTAFQNLVENDVIHKNPFSISTKFLKKISKDKPFLKKEEAEYIIKIMKSSKNKSALKYADITSVLLGTGMRLGEMRALGVNEIDFAEKVIHVKYQVQYQDGVQVLETVKSKAGERDIPILPQIELPLKRLIRYHNDSGKIAEIDGHNEFILVNSKGGVDMLGSYSLFLTSISSKQDNLPHLYPHLLRHTFCSHLIQSEVDIKTAQYVMGHADVEMTLNVYTHISSGLAKDFVLKKMGNHNQTQANDTNFTPISSKI